LPGARLVVAGIGIVARLAVSLATVVVTGILVAGFAIPRTGIAGVGLPFGGAVVAVCVVRGRSGVARPLEGGEGLAAADQPRQLRQRIVAAPVTHRTRLRRLGGIVRITRSVTRIVV